LKNIDKEKYTFIKKPQLYYTQKHKKLIVGKCFKQTPRIHEKLIDYERKDNAKFFDSLR
jgi:hypothetical protein